MSRTSVSVDAGRLSTRTVTGWINSEYRWSISLKSAAFVGKCRKIRASETPHDSASSKVVTPSRPFLAKSGSADWAMESFLIFALRRVLGRAIVFWGLRRCSGWGAEAKRILTYFAAPSVSNVVSDHLLSAHRGMLAASSPAPTEERGHLPRRVGTSPPKHQDEPCPKNLSACDFFDRPCLRPGAWGPDDRTCDHHHDNDHGWRHDDAGAHPE